MSNNLRLKWRLSPTQKNTLCAKRTAHGKIIKRTVPIILVAICLIFTTQLYAQVDFSGGDSSYPQQSLDNLCSRFNLSPEQCNRAKEQYTKEILPTSSEPLPVFKEPPQFVECMSPEDIRGSKQIFGHDVFRWVSLTPPQNLPIASDYIIGPGDEVNILLWGRLNANYSLAVNRDGTIFLPSIGLLSVAGMTFDELKKFLKNQSKNIVGTDINVTMGKLRSIQIYVLGEVKNPGAYIVSAMSTITDALMTSCGPTQIGSLRKIELKRGSETITTMDFYDFLLKGDKSDDLRLRNGDVVFVPVVGPLVAITDGRKAAEVFASGVKESDLLEDDLRKEDKYSDIDVMEENFFSDSKKAKKVDLRDTSYAKRADMRADDRFGLITLFQNIAGNVKRPAIYELKGETRLLDLINMAGGLSASAFKGRVQIQRVEDHSFRIVFESDLIDIEKNPEKNLTLRDGDLVKIFSVIDRKNTMIISGAIGNPGEYGIVPGETRVSDVISLAGGQFYYSSSQAELTRVRVTQSGPQTERFNIDLSKAMEGDPQHNMLLEINDHLIVRTIPEWQLYRKVTVRGEVRFPGEYTIKRGETLSSLIERVGGFTDWAYLKGAVFTRESVKKSQQRQLREAIENIEQRLLFESAKAIETAVTTVEIEQKRQVMVYRIGLLNKMKAAVIEAEGRIGVELDTLDRFKGSSSDITLEEGDTLTIPEMPNHIQIIGAVYNQNAFVYDSANTVASYLRKAGGMTVGADSNEIYILKVDSTAVSKRGGGRPTMWWDSENRRWVGGAFMSSRLDPGDTIVVPEKVEEIAWLREITDLTTVLFQIAVTTGVVIALF